MSNPRFSLNDCSTIQRQVRVLSDARDGVSVDRAYDIANRALEKLFHEKHPSPAPPRPKAEKVTPRVPCTVHREKVHTFSDGTVWRACSADECLFGKGTKHHSDGMKSGTLYVIELPDAVENDDEEDSQDESAVEELSIDGWASSAQCEAEDGIVPELPDVEITDGVEDCDEQSETSSEEVGLSECN